MKKALILLISLFVFSGGVASAQELGNPAMLIKEGQFDVGFQWTPMFKQGFEDYDLKRTYSDGTKNTEQKGADFENDQYYMATLTYGIIDQINVFARLGMVDGGKWLNYQPGNKLEGRLREQFRLGRRCKGEVVRVCQRSRFRPGRPVHALRQPQGEELAVP